MKVFAASSLFVKACEKINKCLFIISLTFIGICAEKCLNGGKCIQKDTCQCPKGFYGLRCEYCKFLFFFS